MFQKTGIFDSCGQEISLNDLVQDKEGVKYQITYINNNICLVPIPSHDLREAILLKSIKIGNTADGIKRIM